MGRGCHSLREIISRREKVAICLKRMYIHVKTCRPRQELRTRIETLTAASPSRTQSIAISIPTQTSYQVQEVYRSSDHLFVVEVFSLKATTVVSIMGCEETRRPISVRFSKTVN